MSMQNWLDIPFPQPVKLKHRLGAGSVGEVWLAEDASGRNVAIKFIKVRYGGQIPEREFSALKLIAKRLESDNALVKVLHVGHSDEYLWYTMQLADLEGDPPVPRCLARDQCTGPSWRAGVAVDRGASRACAGGVA